MTAITEHTVSSTVLRSDTVEIPGTDGIVMIASTPATNRDMWEEYLRGAWAAYTKFGAQDALDVAEVRGGASTSLFYALVDDGVVVGGVRAQGPYLCASQSHAVLEWEGNPAQKQVRDAITARIGEGVVEMKSAWVSPNAVHAGKLSAALARVALPTMSRLHSRYVIATAADHVLARWESSGGRVDMKIPAAAYPDARYRTRIMWWDRRTLFADADPSVGHRMREEHQILCPVLDLPSHVPPRAVFNAGRGALLRVS